MSLFDCFGYYLNFYLFSFQKDPNGLLLATDVAARGLDIPDVEYIFHYEVPKASEVSNLVINHSKIYVFLMQLKYFFS